MEDSSDRAVLVSVLPLLQVQFTSASDFLFLNELGSVLDLIFCLSMIALCTPDDAGDHHDDVIACRIEGDSASALQIQGTIVIRCYMFVEWRGGRHFHLPLLGLFNKIYLSARLLNDIVCFARDDDTVLRARPKPVRRRLGVSD
jgi:hypothetical protein